MAWNADADNNRVAKQATVPKLNVGMEGESGVAELFWLSGDGPGRDAEDTVLQEPGAP